LEKIRGTSEIRKAEILLEEYFIEDKTFCEWSYLAIRAKVLHCNLHHLRWRGQTYIKRALKKIAKHIGYDDVNDFLG